MRDVALKPEPDIELAMPINRATLICEETPEASDPDPMKYWERIHHRAPLRGHGSACMARVSGRGSYAMNFWRLLAML